MSGIRSASRRRSASDKRLHHGTKYEVTIKPIALSVRNVAGRANGWTAGNSAIIQPGLLCAISKSCHCPVSVLLRDIFFFRIGNVVSAGSFKDLLRALPLFAIF
jgi:hypothetical protein